jgi:hypothetical protein
MHIAITNATLALLTLAMLLLRIFWNRLPSRLKYILIRASIGLCVLQILIVVTKVGTTSERLNLIINWLAIAGYELLIFLFSLLSPRWLTSLSAAILIVPLFSSSIVLPLAALFEPELGNRVHIGHHLFYVVQRWGNPGEGNKGVDLLVYYQPPLAPFLRHKLQTIPFNDRECNANDAIATPLPNPKAILGRCPRWPSESAGNVDKILPLH